MLITINYRLYIKIINPYVTSLVCNRKKKAILHFSGALWPLRSFTSIPIVYTK